MIEPGVGEPIGRSDDPWYETPVMARWTAVPYQTITIPLRVGLAAFHPNGIDRVEFSVNGGAVTTVNTEAINPFTGEREYSVEIRPGPAQIEIRAAAYPKIAGRPRRFAGPIPIRGNSNFDENAGEYGFFLFSSSSEPRTVRVSNQTEFTSALAGAGDGSRILITAAGAYNPTGESLKVVRNQRWISIEGTVPGVDIVGDDPNKRLRLNIARARWTGVTFRPATFGYINEGSRGETWLDGCMMAEGLSRTSKTGLPFRGNLWCTNSHAVRCSYGFTNAELVRKCTVDHVVDVFMRSACVLSCEIHGMAIGDDLMRSQHPDIYQSFGEMRNVFVRGIKATKPISNVQVVFINQPLRTGPMMKGGLFADIDVPTTQGARPPFSQIQGPIEDVAFVNISVGQQWLWGVNRGGLNLNINKRVLVENMRSVNKPRGWAAGDVPPGVTAR